MCQGFDQGKYYKIWTDPVLKRIRPYAFPANSARLWTVRCTGWCSKYWEGRQMLLDINILDSTLD